MELLNNGDLEQGILLYREVVLSSEVYTSMKMNLWDPKAYLFSLASFIHSVLFRASIYCNPELRKLVCCGLVQSLPKKHN